MLVPPHPPPADDSNSTDGNKSDDFSFLALGPSGGGGGGGGGGGDPSSFRFGNWIDESPKAAGQSRISSPRDPIPQSFSLTSNCV